MTAAEIIGFIVASYSTGIGAALIVGAVSAFLRYLNN